MSRSPHVRVEIDLQQIAANVRAVATTTTVPVIAVVKADAYGLGAEQVAKAIAGDVSAFYVFELREAVEAKLKDLGRDTICVLGDSSDPEDYICHGVRPVVWTRERAIALRAARPVLSVDTGQQRFGCAIEDVGELVRLGGCDEAFTHATRLEQVSLFGTVTEGNGLRRHAAGTSLLSEPTARFDAVRPGLALYRNAVRVTTRLVDARKTLGPAGYTRFTSDRHGVILCGYSNGLRPGVCLINGQRRTIIEVGMQSAFVELRAGDKVGDEVTLLDRADLSPEVLARCWNYSAQEVLVRLCGSGERTWQPLP